MAASPLDSLLPTAPVPSPREHTAPPVPARMRRVVVIGGGAAGFFGAIACAQTNTHIQVTLLEAARSPLAKVRISGGGRCNVTHACFEPALLVQHYPRGGKALRGAFSRFQAKDTVAWFSRHGVALKTEADGRMFPTTDDASTIVDCLMQVADEYGVRLKMGAAVQSITRSTSAESSAEIGAAPPAETVSGTGAGAGSEAGSGAGQFAIHIRGSEVPLMADAVLLATGSSAQGYAIAQSLGHTLEPPVPSLFTFNITDPRLQDLAGVSVPAVHLRLSVEGAPPLQQTGPLLITHWGLSGPAVLKLSAWGARVLHDRHYQATLSINWLPTQNPENLRQELLKVKAQLPQRAIATSCPVLIPRRLWERLVEAAGIAPVTRWAELSNKQLNQLIAELTRGQYSIRGKGVFKEEFVTCGGVRLPELDFKTMASRCCPGLYLAGEILDIDGVTGGFNFQSAWTTGWLAGQAMAIATYP